MISGTVNANREAIIHLVVIGPGGQPYTIDAVIDTGFSGDLTLPPGLITSLGLTWLGREQGILADGSVDLFEVYLATVIWDGQPRAIEAEAVNTQPLVGMNLLDRHSLHIDVVDGGIVAITPLP